MNKLSKIFLSIIIVLIIVIAFLLFNKNKNVENEIVNNFSLKENQVAAIGLYPCFVTDDIEKIEEKYSKVEVKKYSIGEENDYYLLVLPKDYNTKVKLFACDINDEGEVVKGDLLIDETKPFRTQLGMFEYIPRYIVEVTTSDNKVYDFTLTFSGLDGSVIYGDTDMRKLIYDISEDL